MINTPGDTVITYGLGLIVLEKAKLFVTYKDDTFVIALSFFSFFPLLVILFVVWLFVCICDLFALILQNVGDEWSNGK